MEKTINCLNALVKANMVLARKLIGHGLDLSDFLILYHLNNASEKKLRRIDLANKLGLTASGVTRMLLPLEKLGIIKRQLDVDDARARFAILTPAGINLFYDALNSLEMKTSDLKWPTNTQKITDLTNFLEELAN